MIESEVRSTLSYVIESKTDAGIEVALPYPPFQFPDDFSLSLTLETRVCQIKYYFTVISVLVAVLYLLLKKIR